MDAIRSSLRKEDVTAQEWMKVISRVEVLLNYLEIHKSQVPNVEDGQQAVALLVSDKLAQLQEDSKEVPIGKDGQPIVNPL